MKKILILLMSCATPVAAQEACDDVWFTRNLQFDRAGYCFGSVLGQALFDNSDCTGRDIILDPEVKRQVEEIKKIEAHHGCKIDTSRRTLQIADLQIRRRLRDLPIRDDFSSGCLGWLGEAAPLYSGHDESSSIIGQVEMGDYVLFSFLPVNGWSYVTTHAHEFSGLKAGGWVPGAVFPQEACADWAG